MTTRERRDVPAMIDWLVTASEHRIEEELVGRTVAETIASLGRGYARMGGGEKSDDIYVLLRAVLDSYESLEAEYDALKAEAHAMSERADEDGETIYRLEAERDEARVEVAHAKQRAINIARGCLDYRGGHNGRDLEIYHQGIMTVVQVLLAPADDTQAAVVEAIGRNEP